MRLLIATFDPPSGVGGLEGRIPGYIREFNAAGDLVVVEALSGTPGKERRFSGAPFYGVSSAPASVPSTICETGKLMRRHSIDSVFLLTGGATAFGVLLLLWTRVLRKKNAVLFYGKDLLQSRKKRTARMLALASQVFARRVLVNSNYTRSLLPHFAQRKSRVLYPSVSPTFGSLAGGPRGPTGQRVLFVGRLVARKGVDDLIDAVDALSRENPDVNLDIVGDGPERQTLENLTAELGLTSKVTFHGSLTGPPLLQMYRDCYLFAMPSRSTSDDVEGFGTVFLEAGWFAKPSVGTKSGGIPEAVLDGRTGILVNEGDVASLADALRRLLGDRGLAAKLGQNARERVLGWFTWPMSASLLKDYLFED